MRIVATLCICLGVIYAKNTLVMAVSENIGMMNPQGYHGNAMFAQNAIYEGLVRVDKNGKIIPSLALSWKVSKDALQYEFILRENVKFSNGEPFNADAVVLNFQSILKNRARHSWSGLSLAIKSIQKVSEYKVVLTLKQPYSATLNELSVVRPFRFLAPSAFPNDLDLTKHNPKPIGTGPYMLIDSKLGVSDTLAKNPYYWDSKTYNGIYYDEVILKVIYDSSSKLAALKSGQIDMIYGNDQIPLEIFKAIQNNKKFHTYLSEPMRSVSVVINSASPTLDLANPKLNHEFRLALASVIDKQKLVKAVYSDIQQQAHCLFITQSNCEEKIQQNSREDAMKWLKEFGDKKTQQREIEILFSGDNPARKVMAEIIQSNFKAAGVKVKLSASESSIYHKRLLTGDFDIAFSESWGIPYEPLTMLYSMLTPGGHIDYIAQSKLINRDKIHQNIQKLTTLNPKDSEFAKILEATLALLEQSGVYIPLTYQRNKAIAYNKIKGIDMGIVGYEVPFWEFYE